MARGETWTHFAARFTNAFGLVLLLVTGTYVTASLTRYSGWSAVLITAFVCTTAVVAIVSSRSWTWMVRFAIALSIAAIALAVVAATADSSPPLAASGLIQVVLLLAATAAMLRTVIGESRVSFRTILGAICVYMVFGLLFGILYAAIDRVQAGAFFDAEGAPGTGDFVFFSFTTLTTTGYGNLVPAEQPGRLFAGLEMLLGQIFLVTLITGLVSAWAPRRRDRGDA